ncbi:MAG: PAS domain-containing protein [bacterium]|nr:PAS domain-containing protein [bacterium]
MQAFLQNVIDSMPSVLVSVDTRYRVTQWNLRAEQVTGVSREAALGQNVSNVFPDL